MATTSPDTLWSMDPSGNYNLTADAGTMQASVQAALVKRANMYVGSAAQRTAFTTAAEGVHWQDTDGSKQEWVRNGNSWVSTATPAFQENILSFGSGWSGLPGLHTPRLIVSPDKTVSLVGMVSRSTSSASFTNILTVPSEYLPTPSGTMMLGSFFFSGGFGGQLSLQPNGSVRLEYSFGTPATAVNIALSGTWPAPGNV